MLPWRYVATLQAPPSSPAIVPSVSLGANGAGVVAAGGWPDVAKTGVAETYSATAPGNLFSLPSVENPPAAPHSPSMCVNLPSSFGTSVAIAGGVSAVGAPYSPPGSQMSANPCYWGYVSVFQRYAGGWAVFQNLTPKLTQQDDVSDLNSQGGGFDFGHSVALNANYLVVGAYEFADFTGRVFVFQWTDLPDSSPNHPNFGIWHFAQIAELQESPEGHESYFGDTVLIDGNTIAVTRPGEPGGSESPAGREGKVYLYTFTGSTWTAPLLYLRDPMATSHDGFGFAAALSGDTLAVRIQGSSGSPNVPGVPSSVWGYVGGSKTKVWNVDNIDGSGGSGSVAVSAQNLVIGEPALNRVQIFDRTNPTTLGSALIRTPPAGHTGFGSKVALLGNTLLVSTSDGAILEYVR